MLYLLIALIACAIRIFNQLSDCEMHAYRDHLTKVDRSNSVAWRMAQTCSIDFAGSEPCADAYTMRHKRSQAEVIIIINEMCSHAAERHSHPFHFLMGSVVGLAYCRIWWPPSQSKTTPVQYSARSKKSMALPISKGRPTR